MTGEQTDALPGEALPPSPHQPAASGAVPGTAAPEGPTAATVFYDGACPLCAAEIGFYRQRRGAERIDWVDVRCVPGDAAATGLTRDQALRRFHVRDGDGRLISGGRAFAAVWLALPGFAWLGRMFRHGRRADLLDRLYDVFLVIRPRLQAVARRWTARERV